MGGVIGITTSKFLIVAATLCLPVRVDHAPMRGVIDARMPVSVISVDMARRLHMIDPGTRAAGFAARASKRPVYISIGAEEYSVDHIAVSDTPFAAPGHCVRDVILGRDMLESHVFDIDFAKRRIKLVLPYERDGFIRGFRPVRVIRNAQGEGEVDLRIGDAAPIRARLDLGSDFSMTIGDSGARHLAADGAVPSSARDSAAPMTLAHISLDDVDLTGVTVTTLANSATAPSATLGLGLFDRLHIILDLPHNLIWIKT
jgi:hypothetical protein